LKFTRKTRALSLVLIILLTVITSSCTHLSQPAPVFTPTPVPTDRVTVKYSSFDPPSVIVAVGTTVNWTNNDEISYLIVDNNQTFAFNLPIDGSFDITFTETGTYHYHCSVQPFMQGTIVVVQGAVVKIRQYEHAGA
jgi:plastocyanin